MPDWKHYHQLGPHQSPRPILWQHRWEDFSDLELPEITNEDMHVIQGDGTAQRVFTYGHAKGNKRDGTDPHFITTRTSYQLHTDTGFVRFTHQVVLRNDGFLVGGLAVAAALQDAAAGGKLTLPVAQPVGSMYCLDTHSPHGVFRDDRLPQAGIYKLQAVVDADHPLTPEQVVKALTPLLSEPKSHITRLLPA